MKKLIFILSVAFITVNAFSKNPEKGETKGKAIAVSSGLNVASLSGRVVDHVTGEALTGVEVNLYGTDVKVFTDFDGNFTFSNLQPGAYAVVAKYISYNLKVDNVLLKKGTDNSCVIKLQDIKK
jgi:hypothetical protein